MKNTFQSLYIIIFPIILSIAFLINLLTLFGVLDGRYMGLGLMLVSLCSVAYLGRLMVKSRFFKISVQKEDIQVNLNPNSITSKLLVHLTVLSLIGWIITLFMISMYRF